MLKLLITKQERNRSSQARTELEPRWAPQAFNYVVGSNPLLRGRIPQLPSPQACSLCSLAGGLHTLLSRRCVSLWFPPACRWSHGKMNLELLLGLLVLALAPFGSSAESVTCKQRITCFSLENQQVLWKAEGGTPVRGLLLGWLSESEAEQVGNYRISDGRNPDSRVLR